MLVLAIAMVFTLWAPVPNELLLHPDWIFTNGKILTVDQDFSIVDAGARP